MAEIDHIIDGGVRCTNESLDIIEKYFPGTITDIARVILTTIVKNTAQQAYQAGKEDQ